VFKRKYHKEHIERVEFLHHVLNLENFCILYWFSYYSQSI